MEPLTSLILVLAVAWLVAFVVDQIVKPPYLTPVKVILALALIVYLLWFFPAGLPMWRHS